MLAAIRGNPQADSPPQETCHTKSSGREVEGSSLVSARRRERGLAVIWQSQGMDMGQVAQLLGQSPPTPLPRNHRRHARHRPAADHDSRRGRCTDAASRDAGMRRVGSRWNAVARPMQQSPPIRRKAVPPCSRQHPRSNPRSPRKPSSRSSCRSPANCRSLKSLTSLRSTIRKHEMASGRSSGKNWSMDKRNAASEPLPEKKVLRACPLSSRVRSDLKRNARRLSAVRWQ